MLPDKNRLHINDFITLACCGKHEVMAHYVNITSLDVCQFYVGVQSRSHPTYR
jgi:hypothetical protein